MKLQVVSAVLLLTVASLSSCKKGKADEISILGKWNVKGYENVEFYSGTNHYSSGTPSQGAYIEFKSDGTLYAVSIATFSSGTWKRSGSTLTLTTTGGTVEIWTIKKLTTSELVLYQTDKDQYPTDYFEMTVYCGR